MAFPQGFNFRSTLGFVTDVSPSEFWSTAAYPKTTASGNSAGWIVTSGNVANRSATNDARLAGIAYVTAGGTQNKFQILLPSAGSYNIRIALGDAGGSNQQSCTILDNTTLLATIATNVTTATQHFLDATGVDRTNTTWPGSNALLNLTFASTFCVVTVGVPSGNSTTLAHFYIESAAAPARLKAIGSSGGFGGGIGTLAAGSAA